MKILRWSAVKNLVQLSRPTIWRKERVGEFPARRKLGPNSVGWSEEEIIKWLENRPQIKSTGVAANGK